MRRNFVLGAERIPMTNGGKSAGGLSRNVALEAALFRPALQSARFDSSLWKAKAIESSIMNLPPINVPQPRNPAVHFSHCAEELLLASSNARRAKASFRVVDISKKSGAVSSCSQDILVSGQRAFNGKIGGSDQDIGKSRSLVLPWNTLPTDSVRNPCLRK